MSGDYTRFTDKPRKRYSGVLMQQGRVQIDADWNEQTEIVKRRWETQAIDTFGHSAVPKNTTKDAFKVGLSGTNLTLGEGRIYVEGLLAEILKGEQFKGNPITYLNQPFYPTPPALPSSGNAFVYLDVWEREVTYIEDPELLEKALGGPDTTTRTQTVWQVKVNGTGTNPAQCGTDLNSLFPPSGGRLTTQAIDPPASDDPCIISPSGGYRGLENRLYRVEIHTPGNLASAKFKWSRENASVVSEVTNITTSGTSTLTVRRIGRDKVLRFQVNDWVEVLDDNLELMGGPGIMARIAQPPDEANLTITLDRSVTAAGFNAADASRHTRVRRWDQQTGIDANGLMAVANAFIPLEDGVQVSFNLDSTGGKKFEVGDYWVFAARTADSSVETLVGAPPRGIIHNYCQLAVLTGLGGAVQPPQDCRPLWPPDVGGCDCCCTISVGSHGKDIGDFPDLPSALAALPTLAPDTGKTAEICLLPGIYILTAPIVISRPRLIVKGCGPDATEVISSPNTAFRIDARGATLEGMNIEGGDSSNPLIEITSNGDDCRIEGNHLSSSGNTVQTRADIDGLSLVKNSIEGAGVLVGGSEMLIRSNQMRSTLKIRVGSHGVRIQENDWLRVTGLEEGPGTSVIDRAAIVLGANQSVEVRRTITEIDIIDNRIELADGSGIVSARFENGINESQALGLRIIGNRIVNCVRQPANRAEADPPFGGIVLAGAQHLIIRDNRIEDNGVNANTPVCGIYVRHSSGLEISGNVILNNGRRPDGQQIKGPQGGIIALGASVVVETVTIPGAGSRPIVEGFPAALIADNIVSAPRGQALFLRGAGPMLVHGNNFSSYDLVGRLDDQNPRLEEFVGAVLILNVGMPAYIFASLAAKGFSSYQSVGPTSTGGQDRFTISGKVQFVDNQVKLDLSARETELGLAAVALLSMDDLNVSNNQTECILRRDVLIFDLFALGITTRQIGNGLTETPGRCGFSMLSLAVLMNTGVDNQGTHCIGVIAPAGAKRVAHDNSVLVSSALCKRLVGSAKI